MAPPAPGTTRYVIHVRLGNRCDGFSVNMAACTSVFLLMCNGQIETLEVLRLYVLVNWLY